MSAANDTRKLFAVIRGERTIPDHYAVYVDLGRLGIEAVVDPEETRATIIDRLRRSDYPSGSIRYVLHIVDGLALDETDELLEAAEQIAREIEHA